MTGMEANRTAAYRLLSKAATAEINRNRKPETDDLATRIQRCDEQIDRYKKCVDATEFTIPCGTSARIARIIHNSNSEWLFNGASTAEGY